VERVSIQSKWVARGAVLFGVATTSSASRAQQSVHFEGTTGTVHAGAAECTMPCTLDLAPGRHDVRLNDKTFKLDVAHHARIDARYELHVGWTPLVIGGVVILAGFGGIVAGSILGSTSSNGLCNAQTCTSTEIPVMLGSIGVMAIGGIIMFIGALNTGYRFQLTTVSSNAAPLHPFVDGRGIGFVF